MVDKRPRYSENLTFDSLESKGKPIAKSPNKHSHLSPSKHPGSQNINMSSPKHLSPNRRRKDKHKHKDKDKDKDNDLPEEDLSISQSYKQIHYISTTLNQSFKEYAYQDDQNTQFREEMQDYGKIIDKVNNDPTKSFFSLFDGHGGSETAKYISEHFFNQFLKYINEKPGCVEINLQRTFFKLDDELKKLKGSDKMGATATVIYINKETDAMVGTKKVLYCANVGDSSCLLFSKSGCKKLTSEHKCTDESEIKRIKRVGGNIINERLSGTIAISRAFGDFAMKEKGLIVEPSINKVILSDNDKFIILCTDGIWDVITEEDLFYLTLNNTQTDKIAKTILKQAKENGSTDNMSCIVIRL